ncbi:hypothetical protein PROFUN_09313 [Planoprotostelium fungivorum]|uniref:Uncharacterized protein n=1 Tax=Planoprotostelium fungivorum TaxID=1890364 RepID=A0A2P6NHC5_9EUKA|nr:hypothetical protein PROFUN_09313 [Planoprotostelium fungivorum]
MPEQRGNLWQFIRYDVKKGIPLKRRLQSYITRGVTPEDVALLREMLSVENRSWSLFILDYLYSQMTQRALDILDERGLPGTYSINLYQQDIVIPAGIKLVNDSKTIVCVEILSLDVDVLKQSVPFGTVVVPSKFVGKQIHCQHLVAALNNPDGYLAWSEQSRTVDLNMDCPHSEFVSAHDDGSVQILIHSGFKAPSNETSVAWCVNARHIEIPHEAVPEEERGKLDVYIPQHTEDSTLNRDEKALMNVIQMAMNGEDISTVGKSIINDPRVDQFVDDSMTRKRVDFYKAIAYILGGKVRREQPKESLHSLVWLRSLLTNTSNTEDTIKILKYTMEQSEPREQMKRDNCHYVGDTRRILPWGLYYDVMEKSYVPIGSESKILPFLRGRSTSLKPAILPSSVANSEKPTILYHQLIAAIHHPKKFIDWSSTVINDIEPPAVQFSCRDHSSPDTFVCTNPSHMIFPNITKSFIKNMHNRAFIEDSATGNTHSTFTSEEVSNDLVDILTVLDMEATTD